MRDRWPAPVGYQSETGLAGETGEGRGPKFEMLGTSNLERCMLVYARHDIPAHFVFPSRRALLAFEGTKE